MKTQAVRRKEGASRRIFIAVNYILCTLVALLCLLPVVHVLAISFSSKLAVFSGNVYFLPRQATLDNYRFVMRDSQFFNSYGITVIRAVMALVICMPLMILAAYPLSLPKSRFSKKRLFTWFFIVPMLFNGGMIPTYLVVKGTGLIDTLWALVLPCAVPPFYLILLMNYIKGLPESLMEAAYIDGANRFQRCIKITLPSIMPTVSIMLIMAVSGILGSNFDQHLLLMNANNVSVARTIDVYVYQMGLQAGRYSYATAVNLARSVVSICLLVAADRITRWVSDGERGLF